MFSPKLADIILGQDYQLNWFKKYDEKSMLGAQKEQQEHRQFLG